MSFFLLGGRLRVLRLVWLESRRWVSEANWRRSDRLTPVNHMVGAGADLLACLIWQLMVLMESVGAWLELIGPDGAKYALESLRIYFFIHHQCRDLGVGLSCVFIILKEILHHWRDGPMHKNGAVFSLNSQKITQNNSPSSINLCKSVVLRNIYHFYFIHYFFILSVHTTALYLAATLWGLTQCDPTDWRKNRLGKFHSPFPLKLYLRNVNSSL